MQGFANRQFLTSPQAQVRIAQFLGQDVDVIRWTFIARPHLGETPDRVLQNEFWEYDCLPTLLGRVTEILVTYADNAFPPQLIEIDGAADMAFDLSWRLKPGAVKALPLA